MIRAALVVLVASGCVLPEAARGTEPPGVGGEGAGAGDQGGGAGGTAGGAGGGGGGAMGGAGGSLGRCGPGTAIELTDDFEDPAIDPQWVPNASLNGTLMEAGVLHAAATGSGEYAYYSTSGTTSVEECGFFVEITPESVLDDVYIAVLSVSRSEIVSADVEPDDTLAFGAASDPPTIGAFDPVAHKWFRIRNMGDQFFFDTAPDGKEWELQAVVPTPGGLDPANVYIEIGVDGATSGTFDNFNITPP